MKSRCVRSSEPVMHMGLKRSDYKIRILEIPKQRENMDCLDVDGSIILNFFIIKPTNAIMSKLYFYNKIS